MGSDNFLHKIQQHPQKTARFAYAHEYAEPKKQAFIRNLPPTVTQHRPQQTWESPTNSNELANMYENVLVLNDNSNENVPT